jgi:hypothetical protein
MRERKGSKLISEKRLWALQLLWAVRRGEIARDHGYARTALQLLRPDVANEILLDVRAPKTKGFSDVMRRRIRGSFEINRRHH